MKTNVKKSFLAAALMLAICSVCFTANAIPVINGTHNIAVSDTGKMDKMSKMSKPMKKKKNDQNVERQNEKRHFKNV